MYKDTLVPIGMLVLGIIAGYLLAMQTIKKEVPEPVSHDSQIENVMHDMTSGLEGKTGEAFEQAFLEEMTIHHLGAIEMAQSLLANTSRPELKNWQKILSRRKREKLT